MWIIDNMCTIFFDNYVNLVGMILNVSIFNMWHLLVAVSILLAHDNRLLRKLEFIEFFRYLFNE